MRKCRDWVTYQDPARSGGMRIDGRDAILVTGEIVVPSSRLDRDGGPGEGGCGAYRPALVNAQLHWAAVALPAMLRDAAFASRSERYAGCIIGMLSVQHRSEWLRHRYEHPLHPLKALLSRTAVAMATIIESEGWP